MTEKQRFELLDAIREGFAAPRDGEEQSLLEWEVRYGFSADMKEGGCTGTFDVKAATMVEALQTAENKLDLLAAFHGWEAWGILRVDTNENYEDLLEAMAEQRKVRRAAAFAEAYDSLAKTEEVR